MPEGVAGYGRLEMFPMHEVAADGVAPVHVSPFRPIGVVLEIEVVLAVLIHQSVGVVHPSVLRCVVIDGAVVVGVLHVPRVGEPHLLQCECVPVDIDHLHHCALACREFEGHLVVYPVDGEANVHPCVVGTSEVELNLSLVSLLFDRKDEVFRGIVNHNNCCVAFMLYVDCLSLGCCGGESRDRCYS